MSYWVNIEPKGLRFLCPQHQTVMEAGQALGFRFPVSCRNGVCHICRASLESGSVSTVRGIVSAGDGCAKEIYVCHATPQSDLVLQIDGVLEPKELPMKELICQIKHVEKMQSHVYRVILQQPAGKPTEFYAGQYLSLVIPGRDSDTFFSIASAPGQRDIELHIQADPHLAKAVEVIDYLKGHDSVQVRMPFGKACLDGVPNTPILLLAAGTGYAQMQSIIEFLLAEGFSQELMLYWAARKPGDLYAMKALEERAANHANFSFQSFVSDSADVMTTDHHSLLADAVLEGHSDLTSFTVFVAGSPKMVYSSLDALEEAGLREEAFFSDVLEYVSRDQI